MATRFCQNCGKEAVPGQYCAVCGHDLEQKRKASGDFLPTSIPVPVLPKAVWVFLIPLIGLGVRSARMEIVKRTIAPAQMRAVQQTETQAMQRLQEQSRLAADHVPIVPVGK